MKKVSVIIPTFNNSEENLDRLLESLSTQTMSPEDFDVIFIDDGSDKFESFTRLINKTKIHNNCYVYRISPSGWSSRPRNKGIKLAKSKYVFFCDDDDTIFPQALEKMFDFAEENNLDVVNPKIIRTKGWSWGWNRYKQNKVNAELDGIGAMGPMTVPKLYKRSFLINNNLYFTEGEKVWWEDVLFSCLVYSKKPNIGVLADYPVYHWRTPNVSAGFKKDIDYKWKQLNNLADFFDKHLHGEDKLSMITHWYQSRVLKSIHKNFHKKNESTRKLEFESAKEWKAKHVTSDVISRLNAKNKILDKILELNDQSIAFSYSENRTGITARSYIKDISFKEDKLVFTTEAVLTNNEETNTLIMGNPKSPKITLPKNIKKLLPRKLRSYQNIDFDNNMYLPALKGRYTRATWHLNDIEKSEFEFKKRFLGYEVKGTTTFMIRLEDYIHDQIDNQQPYDLATRFSYLDFFSQRAVTCEEDVNKTAIINGKTYLIYKNKADLLSIDLNSTVKNFFGFAKFDLKNISKNGNLIRIPINADYIYGNSKVKIFASLYNESTNEFIDTEAHLTVVKNKAYIDILNENQLTGTCTIDISLGNKPHRCKIVL